MAPTVIEPQPTETDEGFFCPHCGVRAESGSIFCRKCGAALGQPVSLTKTHEQPESSVPQVRPWVRYWARMFDLSFYAIVVVILLSIYSPTTIERISDLGFETLLLFSWVFVESFLLSAVGTTPGKELLKIHLMLPGHNSIPFVNAFDRSLRVWWFGLGTGFPLVSFFTLSHAESVLSRDSITSWDREGGFVVSHERIGAARGVFTAAFLALFYGLSVLGTIMGMSQH